MKAKIKRIELVNGALWTVTLDLSEGADLDCLPCEEMGCHANQITDHRRKEGYVSFYEQPDCKVGDLLTEDGIEDGGSAEVGIEQTEMRSESVDMLEVWGEKYGARK